MCRSLKQYDFLGSWWEYQNLYFRTKILFNRHVGVKLFESQHTWYWFFLMIMCVLLCLCVFVCVRFFPNENVCVTVFVCVVFVKQKLTNQPLKHNTNCLANLYYLESFLKIICWLRLNADGQLKYGVISYKI